LSLILVFSAAPAFAADTEEGKGIFETICGICHQLPAPEALNMKQWERVLKTMETRMKQQDMSPLSPEETEKVLLYLKENARK